MFYFVNCRNCHIDRFFLNININKKKRHTKNMDPDLILCMYSNTVESTEKKEKCLIGREREGERDHYGKN